MSVPFRYFTARLALVVQRAPARRRQLASVWQHRRPDLHFCAELVMALFDLVGLFDGYEAISNVLKPGTRPLSPKELHLLQPIFGNSIPYHLIRIDERAWLGPRWGHFCYVSFHTINSWGPMADHILVHEVVHVWQYARVGAAYIPRALRAQFSELGYNYGGLEPLSNNRRLEDFNYEQQADIIEDAYRLSNYYQAQWHGYGPEVLPRYYPYLRELRAPTWTEST